MAAQRRLKCQRFSGRFDVRQLTGGEIVVLNETVTSFVPWGGSYEQARRGFARAIVSFEVASGRTLSMMGVYLCLNPDLKARLNEWFGGHLPVVEFRRPRDRVRCLSR
jgi:hypothetical protein